MAIMAPMSAFILAAELREAVYLMPAHSLERL